MADEVKEEEKIDSPEASGEVKEEEKKEKPKSMLGKIGDAIVPDHDEQLAIISTFVRLGILVWSGGILTLNYVAIPNFPQKNIDPTFIASVFTGVLATFGVQTAKNKGGGGGAKPASTVSKADMEKLIEKASQTAPAQVIRIEQAPLNLTAAATPPTKEEPPYKM
tara:strand:- start:852 stop:1346 length:495 start_codon:yes stop_codon:yes gene_type:complete